MDLVKKEGDTDVWKEIVLEDINGGTIVAMEFWKELMQGKNVTDVYEVPWTEFTRKFEATFQCPSFGPTTKEHQALRAILDVDEDARQVVTNERWQRFVNWFPMSNSAHMFLSTLLKLLEKEWFHGSMTKEEADMKLCSQKSGTYLVRFSSQVSYMTVSWIKEDKKSQTICVEHKRLGKDFMNDLESFKKDQRLKYPCPERPAKFCLIFRTPKARNTSSQGGYVASFGDTQIIKTSTAGVNFII